MAAFIDIDGCIVNLDHVVRVTVSRNGNDCTTTAHLTDHALNSREDVFPGDLREASTSSSKIWKATTSHRGAQVAARQRTTVSGCASAVTVRSRRSS